MPTKFKFIALFLAVGLAASGCAISVKTSGGGLDGAVYKTADKGETWAQKSLVLTVSGQSKTIKTLDGSSLAVDPSDNKAVYYGTVENGLWYTYDGGESWQAAKTLGAVTIKAIAVDSADKCNIYVAVDNKVIKSVDCARTWQQAYYDNDPKVAVTDIAIDAYNSANVYISTTRGEVIKSFDRGSNWRTMGRFDNDVLRVAVSSHDSRIIFAGTSKKAIFRSLNGGETWQDLSAGLKDFQDSYKFRDLVLPKSEKGLVLLATRYGLLKSKDNGDTWEAINLITPEKDAVINALAASPKNSAEIYYVTNTTFYRSGDGGNTWTTKKLPSTRAGWNLAIDPVDTSVVYLTVRTLD